MGDSGGGCPAAGAAILARDRRIALARQILIHPMLDDRNLVHLDLRQQFHRLERSAERAARRCE
ncbi:MAG TPA: hypothetical protein VGJ20_38185 [Xanthobacteraceae bacterium]